MELKNIIFAVVIIAFVVAISLIVLPNEFTTPKQKAMANLSFQTFGRVGDVGYVIYDVHGSGKITLLALREKPMKRILILKDSGVGMEHFEDFAVALHELDKLGYNTKIINPFSDVKESIVVVPTGAMPKVFLDRLESIDSPVIYIGAKDLVISGGIKREHWYTALPDNLKSKITVIESTANDLFANKKAMENLLATLRENSWAAANRKDLNISDFAGSYTETITMANASYIRFIFQTDYKTELIDSGILNATSTISINATGEFFPWEKLYLTFDVKKSNGTIYVEIEKNGNNVIKDKWQRVSEGNVFIKSYQLNESGTYIIKIIDNSGVIGGTSTHVKDLQITHLGASGYDHKFSVKIDGRPLKQGVVKVSLNNSTKAYEFYILDGMLTIPAKLEKGDNVFHFSILGSEKDITIANNQEEILDIYFKYGMPGLLLVLLAYGVARILRRPVYVIRVSDWFGKARKEIRISADRAKEIFIRTRRDLGINGPLTVQEYGFGLKRYSTEGAEITEGNIEQILKQLSKSGLLKGHDGYYQLAEEGDVRKNVLKRIIRDELIKKGIKFEVSGNKFITPQYEIGFFGDHFEKKAFIVFDNEIEMRATLSKLDERTKAAVSLQRFNNKIEFVTKYNLEEAL